MASVSESLNARFESLASPSPNNTDDKFNVKQTKNALSKDAAKLFLSETNTPTIISNMKYIENCRKKLSVLVANLLLKRRMVMPKMTGTIDIPTSPITV